MTSTELTQEDYKIFDGEYQVCLRINTGVMIPKDDPVRILNAIFERLRRHTKDEHICGDRNSYSKTDHDATFMRMKEDHMRNGQLKPGYNVNVATASEYIIGSYVSADHTDTKTLIPFAKQLGCYYFYG